MTRSAVDPRFLFAARLSLGAIWLHEGLWRKIIERTPHELAVVKALPLVGGASAVATLAVIGAGETLLGLGVLSGTFYRFVGWFQAVLLVTMNSIGIVSGGSAIEAPVDLLLKNAPIVLCAIAIALHGPGALREVAR